MEMRELPIAVFDSGLGGISVLKRICLLLPEEKFIYFGDSANAPYGEKSAGWILERSREIASGLYERGIKALVVACNTATSVAASDLRGEYSDIPIIGLEPALKPAVTEGGDGAVVVMATPVTLAGEKFKGLLEKYEKERVIVLLPAPKLVEFVERGVYGGEEVEDYLRELAKPCEGKKISSVVLGCTHFPFVKESISEVFGDVGFYDGALGTAKETVRQLELMENSLGGEAVIDRSWELFERRI